MDYQATCAALALPWRAGGHNGQVVCTRPEGDDESVMVAVFMAPELAEDACRAHNAAREAREMSG